MNDNWLAQAKASARDRNSDESVALANLIKQAEEALKLGPFSVMDKKSVPPSGDKHDYMSYGPYWWPNPKTKTGLPYIRRDGERNPETKTDGVDHRRLGKTASAAVTLALAYHFTGKEKYAARAALLLRVWFLNTDTLMNPHLKYGQAIPGRTEGRGIGIIDTTCLLNVVDAVGLLRGSKAWRLPDEKGVKKWFRAYLTWLQTSKHGNDERRTKNNHGMWYDAQVVGFALFVGDEAAAKKVLESVGANRIALQVKPDGRQPHELARTRSFNYSIFNLNAMFRLARLGEHVGVDLWHLQIEGKEPLREALNFVAPYADAKKEWKRKQITAIRRISLLPLLRQGYLVFKDPTYLKLIRKLPKAQRQKDRSVLLYPIPAEVKE